MISVTVPIGPSIQWTKRMLFQPFDLGKWLALGFCAFLANLAGGGGSSFRFNGNAWNRSSRAGQLAFQDLGRWASAHVGLLVGFALAIFLVVLALSLLFLWISSRGEFMFLDGVVHDRAEVVDPWRRFRTLGNSLFWFRLAVGLGGFGAILVLALGGWLLARGDIAAGRFGAGALAAILFTGTLLFLLILVLTAVGLLLRDFAVPVMYRRGVPATEAFRTVWRELVPGNGWTIVLFYLMKLVLGLAAGLIVFLGTCITCCLAGLPYVSSVVFLPVFVFFRTYSLGFLEQFGEEWRLVGTEEEFGTAQ